MPFVGQMQHPSSMDFDNQKKVVMLREVRKWTWDKIAEAVITLKKEAPSERQCRDVYQRFNKKLGLRKYHYEKCGRKPWKITKVVEKFLIKKLLELREKWVCTSTELQQELVREKGVKIDTSAIRKVLKKHGYKWLPRAQKPKFSKEDMIIRRAWVSKILRMTIKALAKKLTMCMDGVILSLPPTNDTQRANYCRIGDSHMWRTKDEAAKPELAGADAYGHQIPYARAVPMWGGIGLAGFGLVVFHEHKKVNQDEWSEVVGSGKLVQACRDASGKTRGPWCILSDNESFLQAPASEKAHKKARVELWQIPARSPDLNPVEKFWSWVRRRLRAMDLADLNAGRPPIQKVALKARVNALLKTRRAKRVAKNTVLSLRKTCKEVKLKRGAAARG